MQQQTVRGGQPPSQAATRKQSQACRDVGTYRGCEHSQWCKAHADRDLPLSSLLEGSCGEGAEAAVSLTRDGGENQSTWSEDMLPWEPQT